MQTAQFSIGSVVRVLKTSRFPIHQTSTWEPSDLSWIKATWPCFQILALRFWSSIGMLAFWGQIPSSFLGSLVEISSSVSTERQLITVLRRNCRLLPIYLRNPIANLRHWKRQSSTRSILKLSTTQFTQFKFWLLLLSMVCRHHISAESTNMLAQQAMFSLSSSLVVLCWPAWATGANSSKSRHPRNSWCRLSNRTMENSDLRQYRAA